MTDDQDKPDELADPSAFQRLEDFARKIFAVPKSEIDEQEKKGAKRR